MMANTYDLQMTKNAPCSIHTMEFAARLDFKEYKEMHNVLFDYSRIYKLPFYPKRKEKDQVEY
jgi:hypothetical protein